MKTISASFKTHLEQTVTTLATIWRLTRTDGEEFFFTDHDQDLNFDGDTYVARSGYNRSAVNNEVGLSVDNLEVEGIFNSDDITEVDLRAGLFDNAEVKISLVNWSALSQGQLKQRRGKLGEVTVTQQGTFRAELRGLTQQLSQNMCSLYQAECRADLGDSKCSVFIKNEVLGRSTAVTVGQTFKVLTGSTTVIEWPSLATNNNFQFSEEGTDVTAVAGWEVVDGTVSIVSDDQGLQAHSGSLYLVGGTASSFELRQDVGFVDTFGITTTAVDAGNVTADFSCYRANNATLDTGRVLVQFLDSVKNPISTMYDTGAEAITPEDTWVQRQVSTVAVPANTRFIRVRFLGARVSGSVINTCIDTILLAMQETQTNTYEDIYENRMYEVTVAGTTAATQPTYDTTVGNTTVDGTATLECKEAWTRYASVSDVQDRKIFKLALTDARAVDDWFNYGALIFESGDNAGVITEIKDWDLATNTITLFLPVPFTVYAGSKVQLYPGCDKRLTTCKTKFANVLNYRGEPFVPGQDELVSYASASSF